ncbi:MAG TPA: alpha-amylase family glycosyl hydrolase [Candidatus Limnocylindrales bacterium]
MTADDRPAHRPSRPARRPVPAAAPARLRGPAFEFHVSRRARERYGLDAALFSTSGDVVLADFAATRALARRLTERRRAAGEREPTVHAGQLNAMGLIDEILHHVGALYRQEHPAPMAGALPWLEARLGRERLDETLLRFVETFPPPAVWRGERSPADWLAASDAGVPDREIALEELAHVWLACANPAFAPFRELFDDRELAESTAYRDVVAGLQAYFATQPRFGPDAESLVAMLRSPAVNVPESLAGQLRYIRERWGLLLGRYLDRLVVTLGVLQEEEVALWLRFHPGTGGGGGGSAAPGLRLAGIGEEEPERFSEDRDWMPTVVLIAKSSYVWLDQLSRQYGRGIRTLDAIPDEELDRLAGWGITGLWLIGLWERSRASQRIKQLRGNPDAVASAYSLMDYRIAEDLGGQRAYEDLRDRARARGIRLSSDMVPNHMGIDSSWVVEHPDWFLSLDQPPYPGYSFTGPDLSSDGRVTIQIEDHYYDGTDAAVVFRRHDHGSGDVRFIYHGNDGTSMPWNDTAQLDYLRGEVREAVIQTILHVARLFPIIRFDAAMTLARKHVERLWFPEPGQGGAIPSRAEHAMPRAEFERLMPQEFWREVVDRVAAEVPDTLLLAEAFWLLEGYFVRTLGMHRVYNSAFMNMLRDEDNAGYRRVIKETLEFDPEILKRYVNFMNNPDERTAVDQFGKGDKYFGVATLLATLPGLPMFGHGQVEGYAEKYGMEYRRAYQDERPDPWLVERHEREIFPLLHRRWLFAEARDFLLYDLFTPSGAVDEDVFAYSNRAGDERALVVYHNRYKSTSGWLRESAAYSAPSADGSGRALIRRRLGEGLGLSGEPGRWAIFRDWRTGLEFLRSSAELREAGLFVELDAYRCQVFLDWREVADGPSRQYGRLAERLGGRGVPSVEAALRELQLAPVHDAARALARSGVLARVVEAGMAELREARGMGAAGLETRTSTAEAGAGEAGAGEAGAEAGSGATHAEDRGRGDEDPTPLLDAAESAIRTLLAAVDETRGGGHDAASMDTAAAASEARRRLAAVLRLPRLGTELPAGGPDADPAALAAARDLRDGLGARWTWSVLVVWPVAAAIARVGGAGGVAEGPRPAAVLDELQLGPVLADALRELGHDESAAWRAVDLIRVLVGLPRLGHQRAEADAARSRETAAEGIPDGARPGGAAPEAERRALVTALVTDPDVRPFIRVNRWEGVSWFHQEAFEQLLWWMLALAAVDALAADALAADAGRPEVAAVLGRAETLAAALRTAGRDAGFRLDRLIEGTPAPTPDDGAPPAGQG